MATQMRDEADFPTPVRSRLPFAAKARIIEMYARFQSVRDIQSAIETEFNVRMQERDVVHYDPQRPQARIGKRLRAMFEEHRRAYIERTAQVAIAHQAHRLRLLSRVVEKAEKAKDFSSALKGLELAAKEMGGVLTNTHKVQHEGSVEHRHLSIEDARGELATRLAALVEGGTLTPLPAPTEGATEEPEG